MISRAISDLRIEQLAPLFYWADVAPLREAVGRTLLRTTSDAGVAPQEPASSATSLQRNWGPENQGGSSPGPPRTELWKDEAMIKPSKWVRLFSDREGNSHFEDIEDPMSAVAYAPPAQRCTFPRPWQRLKFHGFVARQIGTMPPIRRRDANSSSFFPGELKE